MKVRCSIKQVPRSLRRNRLPTKRIHGALVMRHENPAGALGALGKIATTSSRTHGILQHAPQAFERVEVMATMGWEARQATCAAGVVEGRVAFVRPMAPTPSDHHHHLWLGFPAGRQPWVAILAPLRRLTVRDDLREDCGGPVRHRPHAPEQHTAGDPAPGARAAPRVAFARCVPVAVPLAQRVCGASRVRGAVRHPPARGRAKRPRSVSSSASTMLSPRRAWSARAARASEPEARAAGGGARRPGGRSARLRFFSGTTDTGAPELDASVGGAHGRACAASPWRGARARLKRVWLDQTIAMVVSRTGALGGTTGAWTIPQARRALVRQAMAPLAPGGLVLQLSL